jgi:predicted O-methyltransferase YrrM
MDMSERRALDEKVKSFLERQKGQWTDWNVPESDGEFLYNLIIKNHYTKVLDIGTSTGHSAVWMAWALSRTGGKLITIEIDESRYRKALANFEAAGLSGFIDARLADAHDLVKALEGPFDFIFCDADKDWYRNYFMDLAPKIEVGGCFAAHNVTMTYEKGVREFLEYLKGLPHFETTIAKTSREGISLSYKKREHMP